ncbi:alpha/beta hydrolase [Dyadobacter sp. CY347]|uniref:alpha/beta hydrolase n=1 Tax=Dyadobacter sp. CY347 TaxID=2909336 RepID=UPI001F26DF84|nr:alpha/beta hydrolase [Dyadobacter sp. CY347]MCF2489251.1 alpha/beta hydrolase [Dyadobacter sp. CY347]
MANQVIFFHGGGSREDFQADQKLVESLENALGPDYVVHYPFLPNDGTPDLGRRRQISQAILGSEEGVILVAHSLGASMLLASLSEFEIKHQIAGIFLIATPFWEGSEDWVEPFKLRPDFAEKLDQKVPLFFYHCRDDEEVPFAQFGKYKQQLPWATFREIPSGGHQLNNGLSIIADDIRSNLSQA